MSTSMTDEQFNKLPVYVQDEIRRLREAVARLTGRNAWLEDANRIKVAESNTVVTEGLDNNTPLLPYSNVDFWMPEGTKKHWRPTISARLRRDNTGLEIMGAGPIVVSPQASNVVVLNLRD